MTFSRDVSRLEQSLYRLCYASPTPSSSGQVKNAWRCTSILPSAFMVYTGTNLPSPFYLSDGLCTIYLLFLTVLRRGITLMQPAFSFSCAYIEAQRVRLYGSQSQTETYVRTEIDIFILRHNRLDLLSVIWADMQNYQGGITELQAQTVCSFCCIQTVNTTKYTCDKANCWRLTPPLLRKISY